MDELSLYVIRNYMHLMTEAEFGARMAWVLEQKAARLSRREKERFRASFPEWLPPSHASAALLSEGGEAFRKSVSARILREHPGEVVINRCPRCALPARTPATKQCRKCFFDWR